MPSSQLPQHRFAIIGGGISGLAAAHRLSQLLPDSWIELFEASDRLGGVMDTHRTEDLLVERGADSFLNKLPWAVELCRELGIEDQLIPTNLGHRRALVVRDGKLHPVPEGFVVIRPHRMRAMLKTPLLSWRGKLRLLLEPWAASPANIHEKDYDESVASFASRRLGREVFEWLVQPLLAGIYTADPHRLSLAATMPEALAAEREHGSLYRAASRQSASTDEAASGARYASFVTLRGGLIQLVEKLACQLSPERITLKCPIQRLEQTADRLWMLHTESESRGPYQGVIVAVAAPRVAELVAEVDHQLSQRLGEITYASSAIVSLAFSRRQVSRAIDGFGMVVPTVENRPLVAASFSSVKFPGRAPEDQLLVRVFLGGALQPEQMALTDEALQQIAVEQMQELLGCRGEPRFVDVARWQEKMPQYHVGHEQLVEKIERRAAQLPGLELAGNAYHGVGIPQCIHSGDAAAKRLAGSWTQRDWS